MASMENVSFSFKCVIHFEFIALNWLTFVASFNHFCRTLWQEKLLLKNDSHYIPIKSFLVIWVSSILPLQNSSHEIDLRIIWASKQQMCSQLCSQVTLAQLTTLRPLPVLFVLAHLAALVQKAQGLRWPAKVRALQVHRAHNRELSHVAS